MISWEIVVFIVLVSPYTVTDKLGNERVLIAVAFVDLAEIAEISDKSSTEM